MWTGTHYLVAGQDECHGSCCTGKGPVLPALEDGCSAENVVVVASEMIRHEELAED